MMMQGLTNFKRYIFITFEVFILGKTWWKSK